jgi:hypothetical protein
MAEAAREGGRRSGGKGSAAIAASGVAVGDDLGDPFVDEITTVGRPCEFTVVLVVDCLGSLAP